MSKGRCPLWRHSALRQPLPAVAPDDIVADQPLQIERIAGIHARQRVDAVEAVAGRPKLMMLDEPSEGIQPNLAFQIGEIVKKCSSDMGISVIINKQHIGLIQTCAQKCYALDKGIGVGELADEEIQDYNCIKRYLTV